MVDFVAASVADVWGMWLRPCRVDGFCGAVVRSSLDWSAGSGDDCVFLVGEAERSDGFQLLEEWPVWVAP